MVALVQAHPCRQAATQAGAAHTQRQLSKFESLATVPSLAPHPRPSPSLPSTPCPAPQTATLSRSQGTHLVRPSIPAPLPPPTPHELATRSLGASEAGADVGEYEAEGLVDGHEDHVVRVLFCLQELALRTRRVLGLHLARALLQAGGGGGGGGGGGV